MRMGSLVMLVGAGVAVTVASGRTAWAQTPCLTNTDCADDGVFCNGTESCDTNISECVHSGDPCVNGAECNNGPCNENTQCATPAVTTCTDDGNACTADQCDGQGACAHPAAVTCDNSQFCNGIATCNPTDGTCVPGTQPTCDDGVVCTADSCDPTANNNTGACVNAPIAGCCTTDADCDDHDVCTGTETCEVATGMCHPGTAMVCDDGNPCNGVETCDPAAGCQNGTQLDCNDNLVCTNDLCDPAIGCVNAPIPNCCVSNGDCDDGDICNGLETCVNNTCVAGTPPDCDDHNPCTDDTCDAVMACVHTDNTNPCDDGNPCTVNDACSGGQCQGGPAGNANTECRAAAGACDVAEVCDGTNVACPTDAKHASGTACTDDGNPCTTDTCDGTSDTCQHPAGNANAVCRPAVGECDVAEVCDGTNAACPADATKQSGTACTDDGNPCTTDTCDGTSNTCQHAAGNAGTECRAAAGVCDVAEACDGTNTACPADAKETSGTGCTDDGNPCTTDTCDGTSDTCQHPAGNAGTECRAAAGACDVAEACDGTDTACPADAKETSGTACTDDGNPCTAATCDGATNTCQHPAGNAGTECRAAAGDCDVAEVCGGTNTACPADAFQPSTTVCRAGAGACDVAESCTGSSADCPADAFQDQGTVCRAAVDACDIAELCTGSGAACPADAVKTGSDGVTCAFGNTVSPSVCQTESVPPGIQKKFTAAGDLASRALEATGRAHRRLVKKAIAKLRQAIKLADKAEGRLKNPISSNCASPIRDVLTDALDRLLTLS